MGRVWKWVRDRNPLPHPHLRCFDRPWRVDGRWRFPAAAAPGRLVRCGARTLQRRSARRSRLHRWPNPATAQPPGGVRASTNPPPYWHVLQTLSRPSSSTSSAFQSRLQQLWERRRETAAWHTSPQPWPHLSACFSSVYERFIRLR